MSDALLNVILQIAILIIAVRLSVALLSAILLKVKACFESGYFLRYALNDISSLKSYAMHKPAGNHRFEKNNWMQAGINVGIFCFESEVLSFLYKTSPLEVSATISHEC